MVDENYQHIKTYISLSHKSISVKLSWAIIVSKTWSLQLWVLTVVNLGLVISSIAAVFSLQAIPKMPDGSVNKSSTEFLQWQNLFHLLRISLFYIYILVYSMLNNFIIVSWKNLDEILLTDKFLKTVLVIEQFICLFIPLYVLLNGFFIFIGLVGYAHDEILEIAHHPIQEDFVTRSLGFINNAISADPALSIFITFCVSLVVAIIVSAYRNSKRP